MTTSLAPARIGPVVRMAQAVRSSEFRFISSGRKSRPARRIWPGYEALTGADFLQPDIRVGVNGSAPDPQLEKTSSRARRMTDLSGLIPIQYSMFFAP